MFRAKTTFVIGAGASTELRFPSGAGLVEHIALKLRPADQGPPRTADPYIHAALLQHVNQQRPGTSSPWSLSDYLDAASEIATAMPLAPSIDKYMDDHKVDERIQVCGKLALVRLISEGEQGSASRLLKNGTFDPVGTANTWYNRFFKLLQGAQGLNSLFDNVSVVNFNYDRSLEFFLAHAIQTYYRIPPDRAVAAAKQLPIIHPYGTIGPWHEDGAHHRFGDLINDPTMLLSLIPRIQTYTESSAHAESLQLMVREAKVLVFLGFGFIDENMKLLGPHPNTRHTRRIYGTAFGISAPNVELVKWSLNPFLSSTVKRTEGLPQITLVDQTCSKFLDEYARPITSGN